MTETKKDVLNDIFFDLLDAYGDEGYNASDLIDQLRARYAAAPDSPAEVVKVPSEVYGYIEWGKSYKLPLYIMMSFKFVHSQKFEKLTDAVESWIIDHSERFATAWLAWPNVEARDE